MNRVTQRVEEWKRKIVDLSRRNRLLYFARTRASTLNIKGPSLPEVFARLVNSEKAWGFYMPSDVPEAVESGNESTNVPGAGQLSLLGDAETGDSETEDSAPDLDSDELLTDAKDGNRLRSILRNLYRRSRTDFEERGVRILFLTFGVLEWKQVDESEIVKSPIL
jgi:hypothetical protein